MKTRAITLLLFLWCCALTSNAQNAPLPQGKCTIYLLSGKTIKNVQLWKVDSLRIEYIKNGNLADVHISEVSSLLFENGTKKYYNNSNEIIVGEHLGRTFKPGKIFFRDTALCFKHLHVYFGGGRNRLPARQLFFNSFNGDTNQALSYVSDSVRKIDGSASVWLSEGPDFAIEYSINSKLRFTTSLHPFASHYEGCNGNYLAEYQSVKQQIIGRRYFFGASYSFKKQYKRPFGFDLMVGASFITYSARVGTIADFCDSTGNNINPYTHGALSIEEQSRSEKFKRMGMEVYGRVDLYFGRWFSVFMKPYITYDPGFIINKKIFTYQNNAISIPDQTVNFSGLGLSAGISLHLWKSKFCRKLKKSRKVEVYSSVTIDNNLHIKADSLAKKTAIPEENLLVPKEIDDNDTVVRDLYFNKSGRFYNAKIILMDGRIENGIFIKANYHSIDVGNLEIPIDNIRSIQLKRKNAVGNGVLNGIIIGVSAGVIRGLAGGGSYFLGPGEEAIAFGILLSIPGAAVGGLLGAGAAKINIPLNGNESNYYRLYSKIRSYARPEHSKIFVAKALLMDGKIQRGILYRSTQDSIEVGERVIPAGMLKSIEITKKNAVGHSIRNGFFIGGGLGILLSLADFNNAFELPLTTKASVFAALFSSVGAATGALIGTASIRFKISIDGKKYVYKDIQETLEKYSIYK